MLRAALGFFILALLAVIVSTAGLGIIPLEVSRLLLIVFLILAVISFIIGIVTGGRPPYDDRY